MLDAKSRFDAFRREITSAPIVAATELGLCAFLLVLFLGYRDLPLVDLPQHAMQIANWIRLDEAPPPTDLELNLRTPYLLAYPAARALSPLFGVVVALKLVVWASVAAQVAAFHHLCARLGHDRYLALLGVPLALGYAFLFGFVSFVAALPLLYWSMVAALNHGEAPSAKRGLVLAFALALTLVAHGVAFALACVVVVPLLLRRDARLSAFAPLGAPLFLYAIWIAPGTAAKRIGGDYWDIGWSRLAELPGLLVGIGGSDPVASAGGITLLVLLVLGVRRPLPLLPRLLPLGCALIGYFFFPALFRGVGPLGPRFAALIVPALLIASAPRPAGRAGLLRLHRGAIAAFASGWCLLFSF